jgi:hypothetical protein
VVSQAESINPNQKTNFWRCPNLWMLIPEIYPQISPIAADCRSSGSNT